MKRTRILAALLCMMMVMTIVPMMASADVATYDTIEDVLGFGVTGQTYAFTASNASSLYGSGAAGITEAASCSFDTSNGMTVGTRWRIGGDNASCLAATKAVYFRVKVNEDQNLGMMLHVPDTASTNAWAFNITPTEVKQNQYTSGTKLAEFVPGTGFVEYLAVDREDGKGLFVYAKKEGVNDGKWTAILNCTSSIGNNPTSAVYFTSPCTVQELVLYTKLETYDSVADIVGFDVVANKDFNFTASNAQTLYASTGCGCDYNEVTFDTTTGMTLSGSAPRWRIGSNNSSSLGANKAIYFRMKADSAKATPIYIHVPDTTANNTVYGLNVATTGVTSIYSPSVTINAFVPGENYAEYLAVDQEDGTGFHLYAKLDNLYGGKWVEILNIPSGNSSFTSPSCEFYLTAAGSIQQLILYQKDERISYANIDEILDSGYIPEKEFNFTLSNASGLYLGTGYTTSGVTFDTTNGMTPNSGYWRYVPETYYSPVAEGYVVSWRAKVTSGNTLTTYIKKPGDQTQQAWGLKMTESGISSSYAAATDTIDTTLVPGTDWVDFLAVPSALGIKVYASNSDKWYQVAELTQTGAVSNNCGIYFAGNGTYVQKAAIYELGDFSTFESVLGYTGIEEISFTDFMRYDTVKDYSPVENRFFTFRAKVGEGKTIAVYAHDYHTEKNVYAFRITQDGLLEPAYKNATNPAYTVMNNGFVPGTDAQEYLVAENQAGTGIIVYVKLSNGNWYSVLEVVGHAHETPNNNTYGLFIPAVEGCELESATIYTSAALVLADGSGNPLYEDSTLSTPAALVVKGNGATGKVLVVTYKGDDMAKAQILDGASLTAEGTSVDASADGATKVKVFNWDNFTNLNRVNPAITLGL